LRISSNHELILRVFESKLLSRVIKAILSDGQLKQERTTKDEVYFTLLPMTREIKDRLIKEVELIAEKGRVALNLVRQEIRDLVKKNKNFSQDQKRNYENQIDKLKKDYEDKLNVAKEKKIKELS
jgi:ribosome recycling factor